MRTTPEPLIPFPDARLDQKILIDLADGATLLWSDALMGGREARGERWRFSQLANELRLVCSGTASYMDRYNIRPAVDSPDCRWIAGEACYFGTVLALGPAMSRELAANIQLELSARADMRGGADFLEEKLLLVRLVSASGESFRQARASIERTICAEYSSIFRTM